MGSPVASFPNASSSVGGDLPAADIYKIAVDEYRF